MSILNTGKTREYALYKYDSDQILLQHKTTKIVYQYYELPSDNPQTTLTQQTIMQNQVLKEYIDQPQAFQNGLLFEKQLTTLAKQLNNKRRMLANKSATSVNQQTYSFPYQQEQLVNTLNPIINAINRMKQLKITHGEICPQLIVVSRNGQILLRNYKPKTKSKYYPDEKLSHKNDFKALGLILLECLTLKTIQEILSYNNIEEIFKKTFPKNSKQFSKTFLVGVYCLISRKLQVELSIKLILGDIPQSMQTEIDKIYQTISRDFIKIEISRQKNYCEDIKRNIKPMNNAHSKVKQLKGKLIKATQKPILNQDAYLKKAYQIQNNHNLNFINKNTFDDTQNKKVAEEVKKKHMERIAKIIERSNAFTNQLAIKKAHDSALKKMSNSKVASGHDDTQQSKQNLKKMQIHPAKQDALKFSASEKRLVSASKNKNTA